MGSDNIEQELHRSVLCGLLCHYMYCAQCGMNTEANMQRLKSSRLRYLGVYYTGALWRLE